MNTHTTIVETFIARWQGVTASELATAQSFVIDLCRLLEVEVPHATSEQDYMFERPITFRRVPMSIIMAMMGTAATPLMTALQNSIFIGSMGR